MAPDCPPSFILSTRRAQLSPPPHRPILSLHANCPAALYHTGRGPSGQPAPLCFHHNALDDQYGLSWAMHLPSAMAMLSLCSTRFVPSKYCHPQSARCHDFSPLFTQASLVNSGRAVTSYSRDSFSASSAKDSVWYTIDNYPNANPNRLISISPYLVAFVHELCSGLCFRNQPLCLSFCRTTTLRLQKRILHRHLRNPSSLLANDHSFR